MNEPQNNKNDSWIGNEENFRRLIEEVADKAAGKAVNGILDKIGVDIEHHLEMQEDFAWLRRWRRMSEKLSSRALITLITLLVVGIAGLIWASIYNG